MKDITRHLFCMMLALTFVFSTILQFHHHDSAGNIFIYLTGIGEIELSPHNHHFGETCHNHSCHCEANSNHQHGNGSIPTQSECPMHIDETIVVDDHTNDINLKAPAFNLILAILPTELLFDSHPNCNYTSYCLNAHKAIPIASTDFSGNFSHRGPPYHVS